MKNKTLRYTSLSVLTLLAALTLAACGGKTDKNTSASNQKETTRKVTTESASKTETSPKRSRSQKQIVRQKLQPLEQNKRKISKNH